MSVQLKSVLIIISVILTLNISASRAAQIEEADSNRSCEVHNQCQFLRAFSCWKYQDAFDSECKAEFLGLANRVGGDTVVFYSKKTDDISDVSHIHGGIYNCVEKNTNFAEGIAKSYYKLPKKYAEQIKFIPQEFAQRCNLVASDRCVALGDTNCVRCIHSAPEEAFKDDGNREPCTLQESRPAKICSEHLSHTLTVLNADMFVIENEYSEEKLGRYEIAGRAYHCDASQIRKYYTKREAWRDVHVYDAKFDGKYSDIVAKELKDYPKATSVNIASTVKEDNIVHFGVVNNRYKLNGSLYASTNVLVKQMNELLKRKNFDTTGSSPDKTIEISINGLHTRHLKDEISIVVGVEARLGNGKTVNHLYEKRRSGYTEYLVVPDDLTLRTFGDEIDFMLAATAMAILNDKEVRNYLLGSK